MKPSSQEEEYFAREEAEKLRKLAADQRKARSAQERESLKKLHLMHCPRCGMELQEIVFKGVTIDRCFNCHGTFLDKGELEKLAGAEREGLLQSVVRIFKKG